MMKNLKIINGKKEIWKNFSLFVFLHGSYKVRILNDSSNPSHDTFKVNLSTIDCLS